MNIRFLLASALLAWVTLPVAYGQKAKPAGRASTTVQRNAASMEARVDSVLARMNLEEKIGQLTLYTSDLDVTGPTVRTGYLNDIRKGQVGAVFNAYTADFTRKLQKIAVEETRLRIPLLFGYDVIHGFKTIFPIPLGEAASWDTLAMERAAQVAATESAAAGLHWTYAPMVDIARDARWGRIAEGAGEDTYLGTVIARARVRGFQGTNLAADSTILACAKHFAAYGAAEAGRDYNTVDMSERRLRETYLPPFKAAVDAGVATFMTSFNELNGVPSTGNGYLLDQILRKEWGFKGFVVTDYTSINEMIPHGIAADSAQAGELAINAGVDMDMQGGIYQYQLQQLVKSGRVTTKTIDAAVRRVLRLKFMLGLFDDPYRYCNNEREKARTMNPYQMAAALDMARKSVVLLKNENNVLPINKSGQRIALIGPLADNKREMIGSWSAAGDYTQAVSVLEGIRKKLGASAQVQYARGCGISSDSTAGFAEAVRVANQSDVIVAVMGEAALMTGEAASRASIDLPGVQEELLKELRKTGKPIVLVLMNGRPLTINWAAQNVSSILECWFLGTRAGDAVADVLFGDYNPSGKLPVTFPRSVGQIPLYYNAKHTGRPMDKNNKYTSKYLDEENTPLYPFGYGLSYTTFAYSDLKISSKKIGRNQSVKVSVTVKNTGAREGRETVQLYLRDDFGSVTRPVQELKSYRQLTLAPGAAQTVEFTLTPRDLAFYNLQMKYVVEPGAFTVMVGGNSAQTLQEKFEVE